MTHDVPIDGAVVRASCWPAAGRAGSAATSWRSRSTARRSCGGRSGRSPRPAAGRSSSSSPQGMQTRRSRPTWGWTSGWSTTRSRSAGRWSACGRGSRPLRGRVAIVVAGDQPGLRPALLRVARRGIRRADRCGPARRSIPIGGRPRRPGRRRPAPAVRAGPSSARAATADRLLAGGERRLRALIAALEPREVPEVVWRSADPGASWTLDVDRQEDLPARH